MTNSPETKLGLHIPLLASSLVAMLLGTTMMGLIGVWVFTMANAPVPYSLKVSHALDEFISEIGIPGKAFLACSILYATSLYLTVTYKQSDVYIIHDQGDS